MFGQLDEQLREMTPDQLRDILRKIAPGQFSEAQLQSMTPEQLRAEMKKRAGRISDAELKKMTADQMPKLA